MNLNTEKPAQKAPLLDYKETASLLGISQSLLYGLVAKGQIKTVRFGLGQKKRGCTRFTLSDIQDFIEKHRS